MKKRIKKNRLYKIMLGLPLILFTLTAAGQSQSQKFAIGVHADPVISWFSSDFDSVRNDGARSGFNFGINVYRYFGKNYAFSTGINLISAGGRLVSSDTTLFQLSHSKVLVTSAVMPDKPVVYRIQYLSIPIGLKLQTNQIGYVTFFTDLGLDPKIVISKKVDIPANDVEKNKAPGEIKNLNLSYHIMAGIEYAVGGNTAVVIALGFDNNFTDITKDIGDQPEDKISHKLISVRFGVNF